METAGHEHTAEPESHLTVVVTGFGRFQGVEHNPTAALAEALGSEPASSSGRWAVRHAETLPVDAKAVRRRLKDLVPLAEGLRAAHGAARAVLLHLGVGYNCREYRLERQGVNDASFRVPDEDGWQPNREPVVPEDDDVDRVRLTDLPVDDIAATLCEASHPVRLSDNAGRYVCNFAYYTSLAMCCRSATTSCIFVHVPHFDTIAMEEQLSMLRALLDALAERTVPPGDSPDVLEPAAAGALL